MKIIEFLDSKKKSHVVRPYYLEKFYKDLGYHALPKNYFFKRFKIFFYTKFLKKIKLLLSFLLKVKIIYSNPKNYQIVALDDENFSILKNVIQTENYFVLSSRSDRITEIYFTKETLKLFFKYCFKTSFKISYLCSIIELIRPKSVITFIDNSKDFSMIATLLNKKNIHFLAVQNAHRSQINYKKVKVNIPNYYVFGEYEREILLKSDCSFKNITSVGSLTAAVAKKYLNDKHKDIKEDLFDICFISEPHFKLNQHFGHIHQETNYTLQESVKSLANNVLKFCKKHKKKIIFSGKADISSHFKNAEILSYKNMVHDYDFEISFHKKKEFINYKNIMQSKLIIGMNSTILRESFAFRKKVLWCNFVGHIDTKSPSDGICELTSKNFEDFEKRVLEILELNFDQYLSKIKNPEKFYNYKIDTIDFLRNEINNSIKKN